MDSYGLANSYDRAVVDVSVSSAQKAMAGWISVAKVIRVARNEGLTN